MSKALAISWQPVEQFSEAISSQNRDQQVAFTAKRGQQIRVPYAPDMLSTVAYMDKPSTVPVEPIQVRGKAQTRSKH